MVKVSEFDHLFGNSCSPSLPYALFAFCLIVVLVISHFGFEDRRLVLAALIAGHCLHFTNTSDKILCHFFFVFIVVAICDVHNLC